MTQTWSADDNGGGDDSPAIGIARRVIPVVDGAAVAWRRAARIVAWAGVLRGGVSLALVFVGTAFAPGAGGALRDFVSIFRGPWQAGTLMSIYGFGWFALHVLEFVGSVGVLTRHRWGTGLLMAYALGTVPAAALYMVWFAVRTVPPPASVTTTVSVVLNLLQSLAYPAVVFVVMRAARPHLGKTPIDSAFEPLAAVPISAASALPPQT